MSYYNYNLRLVLRGGVKFPTGGIVRDPRKRLIR